MTKTTHSVFACTGCYEATLTGAASRAHEAATGHSMLRRKIRGDSKFYSDEASASPYFANVVEAIDEIEGEFRGEMKAARLGA
jgi:hypothetical protein